MIATLTAVAHPWHCDVMGHMNTRHIVALFDDACFALLNRLGCDVSGRDRHSGWADVRFEVHLEREILAGTVLNVESGIEKLGTSSFRHVHVMTSGNGAVRHATMLATTVRIDLAERKSMPLPEDFRTAARVAFVQAATA